MQASLTEAQRQFDQIVRPALHRGERVILTEHGQPCAEISRHIPTVEVSPAELRSGDVSDKSILEAIAESRQ